MIHLLHRRYFCHVFFDPFNVRACVSVFVLSLVLLFHDLEHLSFLLCTIVIMCVQLFYVPLMLLFHDVGHLSICCTSSLAAVCSLHADTIAYAH